MSYESLFYEGIGPEGIMFSADQILDTTDFEGLGEKTSGKVRDIYDQGDQLLLVATDRYSAFDRNLAVIPHKGEIVTAVSRFWFDRTKHIIPNHTLDYPDPNVMVVEKCEVLPVEVIVRSHITGVTDTSLWQTYSAGQRDYGSFMLPDGLHKNAPLSQPVITPTTKSEHDRALTDEEIIEGGLVDAGTWNRIKVVARQLYGLGQAVSLERGLILADTKYEFGISERGELMLVDELHTPDSSRFWRAASYLHCMRQGKEPDSYDKEPLRIWFKQRCDPYNDDVLPEAPPEVLANMSALYISLYERLTGQIFQPDVRRPIRERIGANLSGYHLLR